MFRYSREFDCEVVGKWKDNEKQGVFLRNQSLSGFGHPHFMLELYLDSKEIACTSFSSWNENDTPSCSDYYWDKIISDIMKLPDDDFEAAKSYFCLTSTYLNEQQGILDGAVQRQKNIKEAEREQADRDTEKRSSSWNKAISKANKKLEYDSQTNFFSPAEYRNAEKEIEQLERNRDKDLNNDSSSGCTLM